MVIAIIEKYSMSESDFLGESSNASNQHAWEEDVALMARIAKGEDAAMSLLVNRWKGPLTRFFNKSLHSLTDAEELTQNTFVKIYRAADRYKPIAKFSTYLFTIARRVLLDEIKRKARHPLDPTDPLELRGESSPVGKMRRSELQEVLEQCLQNLPEKQRTALLLRVQRELTYDDIASIMKVSQGAVKTWIHRARSHLRKNLKPLL
jgi:RNA polymerase sigma-70 factor (ECF subfamily)